MIDRDIFISMCGRNSWGMLSDGEFDMPKCP